VDKFIGEYPKTRSVGTKIKDISLVEKRRREIIRGATEVFTKKGFHTASIRDICKACNMGPGTLYNYIKKKEDILYLIFNELTMMLTECAEDTVAQKNFPPEKQLEILVRGSFEIMWKYQDLVLLIYQESHSLDQESLHTILRRESEYVSLIGKILKRVEKQGDGRSKNLLEADIIVFLLAFIPLRRWNIKRRFSEKEIKTGLVDFILTALKMKKRKE
jgi:AcrR family transcriptional regulator